MVRVLGRSPSINVRKVLWLCHELEIPFVNEPWGGDAALALDSAEFKALNPNLMVPVLVDGDFVMWESNSILRYLAATRGATHLYPADARQRARVDQWLDWQSSDLNPAWKFPFFWLVKRSPSYDHPALVASGTARWCQLMTVLDRQLAQTQAFVSGDTFTLADIVIGLSVHRWFSTPIDHPPLDHVAAYYERLTQREGFRRYGRNEHP